MLWASERNCRADDEIIIIGRKCVAARLDELFSRAFCCLPDFIDIKNVEDMGIQVAKSFFVWGIL